jgi:hypothetical protein
MVLDLLAPRLPAGLGQRISEQNDLFGSD